MMLSFFLQYSEQFAGVFSLGHLGRLQLAAASLATMTATITGLTIFTGISTALDTLCSQAYGSGQRHELGLHLQRCLLLELVCFVPISVIWLNAETIMLWLRQDPDLARLCGSFLRFYWWGAPGYAIFEALKRFQQAQNIFHASTYVLLITAPLNIACNYTFVWSSRFGIGFQGSPIATAMSFNLMALLLALYVRFVDGYQCFGGFSTKALKDWKPMLKLAGPGIIMICSEWWAVEAMAMAASYLGTVSLAAHSIIQTTANLSFQIPFSASAVVAARIGNLVGAGRQHSARISSTTAIMLGVGLGLNNSIFLILVRRVWGWLLTNDAETIGVFITVVPILAAFQIADATTIITSGILRGLGLQRTGSIISLFSYNVLAIPLALTFTFVRHWGVVGLWSGMLIAITTAALLQVVAIGKANYASIIQDPRDRDLEHSNV
ncbi:uncharacterized protein HMPREF1541_06093 [Cyphellophora europaea CBS 101466]|uniref:MATE efflux family protein n=1 Tax=Cyphellophora europaea (strain CBS 101466) TaxID=1220924 RepID=W2RTX1_CYPE1|nr:uncharacterized protein HMPREF1541_06093 [Cyphellophora europaea CBS 101466]ETN39867.1 hypothetical protein HMPREF1541_06093 [Cyphellophora europaea CBS 101466]